MSFVSFSVTDSDFVDYGDNALDFHMRGP